MAQYGADTLLAMSASGKLVLQYRQYVDGAAVTLDPTQSANVMWAISDIG